MVGIKDGATIIYTGTRRDAEDVAEFVNTVVGMHAQYYHAGLPAEERSLIQEAFMSGDLSLVAATNAFGMGIDRPDVRQVIHFSMPGSLEAYYQEAGRAGRDDFPAKAVLLYSPEDRSLQEWFINNSIITTGELRVIYEALLPSSDKNRTITYEELTLLTGLHEVKIRIGLAELERSGFLDRMGNEGFSIRVQLNSWIDAEIPLITKRLEQHHAHRKKQLVQIVYYAESNGCRRKIILDHFGDKGAVEAEICCDNCEAQKFISSEMRKDASSLEPSERIALAILDAVRRLSLGVGREKLAKILKGSKAKEIYKLGYDKNIYYGRLAGFTLEQILKFLDQLLEQRFLKVIGGEYPIFGLNPSG